MSAAITDGLDEQLKSAMQQSALFAKASVAASEFEEFFKLSGVPFFREYTDHSFKHSIDVFQTACEILGPDSQDAVSAEDLIFLMLASLAHDSGLHVTEDIFFALTESSNTIIAVSEIDELSWPQLWADYLSEAKRFNAKTLKSLFGDSTPVQEPPRSSLALTQRDKMLIGDFLRRHHPRLAHEFSIGAIEDVSGNKFDLFHDFEPSQKDLIGLISRSHGMPLRATFPYIENHFNLRDFNRLHIIYVMILLRIADFLQIQPARAPYFNNRLHQIKSPYSAREWRVHQSVDNITTSSFDPEAIYISAAPKTVHDFLKFEQWLKGIQEELDLSWAILGEVYGRFSREHLDKLQLSIRRVRSNTDDRRQFQLKTPYVPEAIHFTVSEAELLSLLMEPLYGDNPLYGVRELTQNAADSVVELDHLKSVGTRIEGMQIKLRSGIEIETSTSEPWTFTIRDQGTGMGLDTIKNYFLKAGASFRNSDLWRKEFTDEKGKSKIARTGRFGVGALSAFLIGDKITVYTRHFSERNGLGYKFSCHVDDDEIELLREAGDIGTIIEIASSEKRIKAIQAYLANSDGPAFYYKSDHPSIAFLPPAATTPPSDEKIKSRWIPVPLDKYQSVSWDHSAAHRKKVDEYGYLYCNGILIGDVAKPSRNLVVPHGGGMWQFNHPTVAVIDKDGSLPVDLARKSLARTDAELSNAIKTSTAEEYISAIFSIEGETPQEILSEFRKQNYLYATAGWNSLFFGQDGFAILDSNLIVNFSPDSFLCLNPFVSSLDKQVENCLTKNTLIAIRTSMRGDSNTALLGTIADSYYGGSFPSFNSEFGYGNSSPFRRSYLILDEASFEGVFKLKNIPKYIHGMRSNAVHFKIGKDAFVICDRSGNENSDDVRDIYKFFEKTTHPVDLTNRPTVLWTNYVSPESPTKETIFSAIWKKSFSKVLLPYSKAARKLAKNNDAPIQRYLT